MSRLILFQGDSITDCHRLYDREEYQGCGYASMVAGVLGVQEPYAYRFLNRGIGGNRSIDLYNRLQSDIIELRPDYMSILIGVNDVWSDILYQDGVSADNFEKIYSSIIEELMLELPDLRIMLLEPFVLPGKFTRNSEEHPSRWDYFCKEVPLRAQITCRIAEKYGLVFVPLQERFDNANKGAPDGYWLMDGVHPTAAGHELIKQAWLEGFEKLKNII